MRDVDRTSLIAYLGDHLTGSVAAVQLMDRLLAPHADTPLGVSLREMRNELLQEQLIVRHFVAAYGGSDSTTGGMIAWAGGQLSRIKLGPGEEGDSGLRLFEALEALALGFAGRHALWRTLADLQRHAPIDERADFRGLAARVTKRIAELEVFRLEASLAALTTPASIGETLSMELEPQTDGRAKVAELLKDLRVAMLVTLDAHGRPHSRPMSTQHLLFDGSVWFFTAESSLKVAEIRDNPDVNIGYGSTSHESFLSLSGRATIVNDRDKIRELWNPLLRAWFTGADDPSIRLLCVEIETAEYWDTPGGKVAALISLVKAAVTGNADGMQGDHGTIELNETRH
jgi:general stress protein 26